MLPAALQALKAIVDAGMIRNVQWVQSLCLVVHLSNITAWIPHSSPYNAKPRVCVDSNARSRAKIALYFMLAIYSRYGLINLSSVNSLWVRLFIRGS